MLSGEPGAMCEMIPAFLKCSKWSVGSSCSSFGEYPIPGVRGAEAAPLGAPGARAWGWACRLHVRSNTVQESGGPDSKCVVRTVQSGLMSGHIHAVQKSHE